MEDKNDNKENLKRREESLGYLKSFVRRRNIQLTDEQVLKLN